MVRQAVEDTNRALMEALKRGDAASMVARFTEDATLLPPNREPIHGKQGVKAFYKAATDMGVTAGILDTVHVECVGDVAYEIGGYTAEIQLESGEMTTDGGKYVHIWKRQADGSWKLHVDIWNTNSPPPAW